MPHTPGLKAALKRGALIAAANWPLVIVGFVTDSSVKLLLAVPIVGGAFLVALLLDTPLTDLLRGDLRDIATSIISALTASPAALAAFVTGRLDGVRRRDRCCSSSSRGAPSRCSPKRSASPVRSSGRHSVSRRSAAPTSSASTPSWPDAGACGAATSASGWDCC